MMTTTSINAPAHGETSQNTESLANTFSHIPAASQSAAEGVTDADTISSIRGEDRMLANSEPSAEEYKEQQKAATVIQSAYRGYHRIELIHKRDAIDHKAQDESAQGAEDPNQLSSPLSPCSPNDNRARWAWRRAEFLSSRLGKGSSDVSTEEALILLTEHWLEMSDKKHRYGSNLKVYHEYWLKQDTSQNFFYWLDKGEGKDVDIKEKPRAQLDEQHVHYLQEHEREKYAVEIVDGRLYYKQSGQLVHTLPESVKAGDEVDVSQILPDSNENDDEKTRLEKKRIRNKAKFIYVTDPKGVLYIARKVKGQFHHSSFLGGGTVCAAGGIIVNQGSLIKINPKSGHYRPAQRHFDRLLKRLQEMGVSLEGVKISSGILDADLDEQARQASSNQLVEPVTRAETSNDK
ncbi:hypothetical protein FBU30_005972 [Linnemannia zychae]|nr:hypothetical protein FBU30_005972 [Linnemannia zychae]